LRQLSMRPSPEHDTANFRTLASKIPSADIAAKGHSLQAPAVTTHHPKSALRVKPDGSSGICSNPDPGPSGFDWLTERTAKGSVPAPRRTRGSAAVVDSKQRPRIDFSAAAALKKWPSIEDERTRVSLFPYLVIDGTLDACIRGFLAKPTSRRHLYEIHTAPQTPIITAILFADQITEIARLREFLRD
jgi:hypothetical protein